MTSFWDRVASASSPKHWPVIAGLLIYTLLACSAQADALRPFTAQYSATLDLVVDIPASAERKLVRQEDGRWLFSSHASSFAAEQSEISTFRVDGGQIQPDEYQFTRSVFGRERRIEIDFQSELNRIVTVALGEPWTQPWEPGVLDKLNYQLQLRADLIAQKETLSYRIADGGQIKTYRFLRTGTERLKTRAGEFNCIRLQLDRSPTQPQTLIWMAPELDYLTVRLLRIDEQGREHILNLKEYQTDDTDHTGEP